MAFHGKYGHLSSIEAAKAALIDLEKELDGQTLSDWCNESIPVSTRYDDMRTLRMMEGLQRVVLLNGGDLSFLRLPNLTNLKPIHKKLSNK